MIHQSAYDTTPCLGYIVEPLKEAVLAAYLRSEIRASTQYPDVLLIEGGAMVDEKIHSFYHPLVVEHKGKSLVAIDVRTMGRYDVHQQDYQVRDKAGYEALLMRGALNDVWVNESPDYLRNVSPLGAEVFAGWLGESVAKRMGLEFADQITVTILAAVLYYSQFTNASHLDEMEQSALRGQVVRATRLPDVRVFDVIQQFSVINDIPHFCTAVQEATQGSTRLKDFNPVLLAEIVGGYWFGTQARQTIIAALEHPPTWLSLMYRAFTDRGMRMSGLTKILDRPHYQRNSQQFCRALTALVKAD